MSVEEWFTMELLYVQDGWSFKTTAQSLLWAALISDQRLQHGPDHIQLYRGTEGSSRWKDIKSLMQSWTSLLSTRSATPRQTESYHHSALVISTLVGGSPLHSGLSALMCWWRAYRCQSLPGHVRQTSKDSSVSLPLDSIWNCVCMCVTVFKYWEATFIVWVIVWVKLSCT